MASPNEEEEEIERLKERFRKEIEEARHGPHILIPPDESDTWDSFHDDLDSLPKRRNDDAPAWVDHVVYGLLVALLAGVVGVVLFLLWAWVVTLPARWAGLG